MHVRAFVGHHELELARSGAPFSSGPVLAATFLPLGEVSPGEQLRATVVIDERLKRHPLRFELEDSVVEVKRTGGEYLVPPHRFTALDTMSFPGFMFHRSPAVDPKVAYGAVSVFLDALFRGDREGVLRCCSEVFDRRSAFAESLRLTTKWMGGHAERERKLEGAVDGRFPRVVVTTSVFGPLGIQAFVLVGPVGERFEILASTMTSFENAPKPPRSGPPDPTM